MDGSSSARRLQGDGRMRYALRIGIALLSFDLVGSIFAMGQEWQAHTPFREATALSASPEAVWVATLGGVFSYQVAGGEIRTYTPVEGLHGIDATALSYDIACDCVWIGYGNGVLDRLSPKNGTVRTFRDIARAEQFQSRRVNRIVPRGDSLFVLTDFGVVVFDTGSEEVRDAYTRIGDWGAATPVRDILVASGTGGAEIWVAGDRGVAHAPLAGVNLREPSAWTAEATLGSEVAYCLAWFDGSVYVGTDLDARVRQSDGVWTRAGMAGAPVFALLGEADALLGLEEFSLVRASKGGNLGRWFLSRPSPLGDLIPYQFPRHLVRGPDGVLWIADSREGLMSIRSIPEEGDRIADAQPVLPQGPWFGLFTDLVEGADGSMWAAGAAANGSGFHRYQEGVWTDFMSRTMPELVGRAGYDHIHADALGSIWAGSEGYGIARVGPDQELTTFDHTNSALRPAAGTSSYVRVRGISSESDGTLWAINQFTALPIVVRETDGSWSGLPAIRASGAPASLSYTRIFVDSYGQKWVLAADNQGLLVWDTAGTPSLTGDDRARYLRGLGSGGLGLPNESVTSWAEDLSGRVWIGTERGIAYFIAPGLVLTSDPGAYQAQWPITEDANGTRSFLLRDLFVNDLAVDPANRLWIASRSGAWLLNSEGTAVVRHYSTDNSPLFSDNVVSVAVDDRSGRVFLATTKGLLSLQGDAVSPARKIQALDIFPNPARLGVSGHLSVTIDGLVAETDVRILTVSGELVRRLTGQGGRLVWDGRSNEGALVPSGVYIVVAVGTNGEGTAYGKVAVLR